MAKVALLSQSIVCICVGIAANVHAELNPAAAPLITHPDPVELPSVGKLLFVFLLTAALAVGIAYALRRILAKIPGSPLASDNAAQVRVRTTLHRGLKLHVVEIRDQTILVAENKNGLAMTRISESKDTVE
jgi:hypothetical protein